MNSDHVQRYHIRQDGVITKTPDGKWVRFEEVELLLKCFNDIDQIV